MKIEKIDFNKQQFHLKNVSRTFALTIPLLPNELIDYISNAYLLCRIADTIEDDPKLENMKKISWLKSFAQFCENGFSDDMQLLSLHKSALEYVENSAKPTELELLKDMQSILIRTRSFPKSVQQILSKGVSILSYGMSKFLKSIEIKNIDDVDLYCYFVAGIVGELLAALFYDYDKSIDKQKIMTLAVSFGEGLQLTNILKDRFEDRQRDVSFLPNINEPKQDSLYYIGICNGHLADAIDFVCLIPKKNKGIRIFCLLNILMAIFTLSKIYKEDLLGKTKVKITRRKVKFLYIASHLICSSNFLIKLFFTLASFSVKKIRRNPSALRNKVSCWEKVLKVYL